MSRVFKAKSKGPLAGPERPGPAFGIASHLGEKKCLRKGNPIAADARAEGEITLVEATPSKNSMRVASTTSLGKRMKPRESIELDAGRSGEMDVDTDIWESELPQPRDIIVRTATVNADEAVLVAETPRKNKPRTGSVGGPPRLM